MSEPQQPAAQAASSAHSTVGWSLGTPVIGVIMTNAATLPPVFEQYPYGTAVLVGLALFGGACCVAVAWLKYRRR